MTDSAERRPDQDVERRLAAMRGKIDYPATPDIAAAVSLRLRARQEPRVVRFPGKIQAIAAAICLLIAGATLSLPAGRSAVAGWFDLPGVSFLASDGDEASPGAPLDLGTPTTLAEARARAHFRLVLPNADWPGAPGEVFIDDRIAGGVVSYVYPESDDLPAIGSSDAGLLITQFQGTIDRNVLVKGLPDGSTIRAVDVSGDTGYWISGAPHPVWFNDANGNLFETTLRLAGNTLVWESNGVILRIESALDRDAAIAIAEAMTSE